MSVAPAPPPLAFDEPRPRDGLPEMWKHAGAELDKPLRYWIFAHARAMGAKEVASRRLARLEKEHADCFFNAKFLPSDAAREIMMANAPSDISFGMAERAVAEATEMAVATELMILRSGVAK